MTGQSIDKLSFVRTTPGVQGGVACIRDTRHTIAGLIEWRQLGLIDPQILERHPDLSQADLDIAWAYYSHNRDEIDRVIRSNEEA